MGKKAKKLANASMALALQKAHISDLTPLDTQNPADTSVSSISRKRPAPDNDSCDNSENNPTTSINLDVKTEWTVVSNKYKKLKIPSTASSNYPSITTLKNSRLQSKVNLDAWRDLVLYIFANGTAPQWVSVGNRSQVRKIVTIMVPGLEEAMFRKGIDYRVFDKVVKGEREALTSGAKIAMYDDYTPRKLERSELPKAVAPLSDIFPQLWQVRAPGDDRYSKLHSPMSTFLSAPIPKKKDQDHGKTEWKNERTRITEFLMSEDDLATNGYQLHPAMLSGKDKEDFQLQEGWVMTNVINLEDSNVPEVEIESGSVTASREVLAIDCEMVMTGPEEMSLARISVVNWSGDIILDELVKPSKPITDYVTQYSGMTPELLSPVTTTLADIQNRLVSLITPRTILLGHSLDSDLNALKLVHPFIVDTAICFPHPRGPPLKQSLRWLTKKYLDREIQKGAAGHNSIEDARACLDLAHKKCEKGKAWGLPEGQTENLFARLARTGTTYKAQGGAAAVGGLTTGKTSAAVDWGDPKKGPGSKATYTVCCRSDEDVVNGVIRAVRGDGDGAEICGGGVDFVWARLRELEALRGWWNTSRDIHTGLIPTFGPLPADSPYDSLLEMQLAKTVECIRRIHEALPPCTVLMVFSGSGDPRELRRLQEMHTQWKKEYNMPGSKWDQLSVRWTDTEEQAMRQEVKVARAGLGFVTVK